MMARYMILALLGLASPAWGGGPEPLVLWRLDPTGFASVERSAESRRLIESGVRTLLATGAVGDADAAAALAGVLAVSVVASGPHEVRLTDLGEGEGGTLAPVGVALRLGAGVDEEAFVRTLRAVLVDGLPEDGPATQEPVSWPGGGEGVRLRRAEWPDWLDVSWGRAGDGLAVLVGTAEAIPPAAEAAGFLTLRVDLDALRAAAPGHVAGGVLNDWLGSLELAHARWFGLRGWWVEDGTIALESAWASRREPPGRVRTRALTAEAAPGWARGLGGSYLLPMRADWGAMVETIVDLRAAGVEGWERMEFDARRQMWMRRHGPTLERLIASLSEIAVITDVPTPAVPIPGIGTVLVEVRGEEDAAATLEELARSLGWEVQRVGAVRTLTLAGPWEALRAVGVSPSWGVVEARGVRVLVVSWSAGAVDAAAGALARG